MYDWPVKYSVTGTYGCHPKGEEDVYTLEEFKECCDSSAFIDDDGHGYPMKDGLADGGIIVKPSRLDEIPKDATHIVWMNK